LEGVHRKEYCRTFTHKISSIFKSSIRFRIGNEITGLKVVKIYNILSDTRDNAVSPKDEMVLKPNEIGIREKFRKLLSMPAKAKQSGHWEYV
jgi:hypothetical protein